MMMNAPDFTRNDLTIGDRYNPAMSITDQVEADAYLEKLIRYNMRAGSQDRSTATGIVLQNLGYYAGYCCDDTRRQVEGLFHCSHPIFGSIAKNGAPTPEQAFEAGRKTGTTLATKGPTDAE